MTGLEIIKERVRCGVCPICGSDKVSKEYKIYKHSTVGDVKICVEHPVPGVPSES